MRLRIFLTGVYLLVFQSIRVFCQIDTIVPITPQFNLLTVQPETGWTELIWSKSTSPDVAGYLIYNYKNGAGFVFDTVHNPNAESYINHGSFASQQIESYEIAAIDSSGNKSPLSVVLNTILVSPVIDTCKGTIQLSWNKYSSIPKAVTSYQILISENGESFSVAGETLPSVNTFTINDFITNVRYCFEIKAVLEGGSFTFSNKACLTTSMQRPPQWINADFATVNDTGNIDLSFSFDPLSQIVKFSLERKKESDNSFMQIAQIESTSGKISFTDRSADPSRKYYYRLSSINNCGIPIVTSNMAGNMVTSISKTDDFIYLNWNPYRDWLGGISVYKVFVNTGNGFVEKSRISPADTLFALNYKDIMYEVSGNEICFYITATETTDIYNITGESRSSIICTGITERITVPTAFTPDNDLVNDLFRPVLSFTPLEYHLVITDRQNNIIFESSDYQQQWDGTENGSPQPQGVYLWFLKVKTPSKKIISKSGTLTIIKNR